MSAISTLALVDGESAALFQELQDTCDDILKILDSNRCKTADAGESKVFCHKVKADYFRFLASIRCGGSKAYAMARARLAHPRSC